MDDNLICCVDFAQLDRFYYFCLFCTYAKMRNIDLSAVEFNEENFSFENSNGGKTTTFKQIQFGRNKCPRSLLEIKQIVFENQEFFSKNFKFSDDFFNKSLYKYISNTTKYIDNYFDNKLFFVIPSEMDDVFDSDLIIENSKEVIFDGKEDARLLCLAQSNNNNALWGLYANHFKGFCFEYRFKNIIDSVSKNNQNSLFLLFGEVAYDLKKFADDHHFKMNIRGIKNFLDEFSYLFVKHESWAFQQEFRFVLINDPKQPFNKKYEPYPVTCDAVYTTFKQKFKLVKLK